MDIQNESNQLVAAIDALQPSKRQQKAELFLSAYRAIEQALAREVPQKVILEALKKEGIALSLGGFRSLLEAERNRRSESGECECCTHCGARLPHEFSTDSTAEPQTFK